MLSDKALKLLRTLARRKTKPLISNTVPAKELEEKGLVKIDGVLIHITKAGEYAAGYSGQE